MHAIYQGALNGHSVGIVLKELVRRAMATIRARQLQFEVTAKDDYDGNAMQDVFTDADRAAQEIYLRSLRECFPHCGIIAEEDKLSIASACGAYFTVDPLDGTKAFIRQQTHGVGTMVALVEGDEVIAAYIGDLNAEVVYGYRPDSNKVHRINRLDVAQELGYRNPASYGASYVLLRDPVYEYTAASLRLIEGGTFKSHQIDGGSIGTWAARLWRREVQALLIPYPNNETPWDSAPVIGISKKLGYEFLRPKDAGWERYTPPLSPKIYKREHDILIVHASDVEALRIPIV